MITINSDNHLGVYKDNFLKTADDLYNTEFSIPQKKFDKRRLEKIFKQKVDVPLKDALGLITLRAEDIGWVADKLSDGTIVILLDSFKPEESYNQYEIIFYFFYRLIKKLTDLKQTVRGDLVNKMENVLYHIIAEASRDEQRKMFDFTLTHLNMLETKNFSLIGPKFLEPLILAGDPFFLIQKFQLIDGFLTYLITEDKNKKKNIPYIRKAIGTCLVMRLSLMIENKFDQEAIETFPGSYERTPGLLFLFSEYYSLIGEYDDAVDFFQRFILESNNSNIYNSIIDEQISSAVEILEMMLSFDKVERFNELFAVALELYFDPEEFENVILMFKEYRPKKERKELSKVLLEDEEIDYWIKLPVVIDLEEYDLVLDYIEQSDNFEMADNFLMDIIDKDPVRVGKILEDYLKKEFKTANNRKRYKELVEIMSDYSVNKKIRRRMKKFSKYLKETYSRRSLMKRILEASGF